MESSPDVILHVSESKGVVFPLPHPKNSLVKNKSQNFSSRG